MKMNLALVLLFGGCTAFSELASAAAPAWKQNPITITSTDGVDLIYQFKAQVSDPNPQNLIFKIREGVPWLQLDADGYAAGIPGPRDLGKTAFEVLVSNDLGVSWVNTVVNLEIRPAPPLTCQDGDQAQKIGLTETGEHELYACVLDSGNH